MRLGDVNGNIWSEVTEGGKDALPVWMGRAAKDVKSGNDIYANATEPGFLNKDNVSYKATRGRYIKKGMNGIVGLHDVL